MRQMQYHRSTTALTASSFTTLDLRPWDRITGARGAFRFRITCPAADAGTLLFTLQIGNQVQIRRAAVPVEEFVGAGPNLRIPAYTVYGWRGDSIMVDVQETAASAASVTVQVELMNVGR